MKVFKRILLVLVCGIIFGAALFGALESYRVYQRKETERLEAERLAEMQKEKVEQTATKEKEVIIPKVSKSDYSELVSAVQPSVVKIEATVVQQYSTWFGFGRPVEYEDMVGGTGFAALQKENKLYIITNQHVIDGASSIKVTFANDASLDAEIVGFDKDYDLALLYCKLDSLNEDELKGIRISTIGSSADLKVGETCIAIGNAVSIGLSTTVGYVSAVDREVNGESQSAKLIQTDCAINPGNSGGPLLDVYGRVIGITSSKYASDDVEGMGFAIPIDTALPIINDLLLYVEIPYGEQGDLGLVTKEINQSYATAFNLPIGIYVSKIPETSSCRNSALRAGDIITGVNGRPVTTEVELENRIIHYRAGETVILNVSRMENGANAEIEIEVTLGKHTQKKDKKDKKDNSKSDSNSYSDPFGFGFNPFDSFGSDFFDDWFW